jgi:hypothetical protein
MHYSEKETLTVAETKIFNLSADESFSFLLDFLTVQSNIKVKRYVKSSIIEVATKFPCTLCDIKTEFYPENGKTRIKFSFDFTKSILLGCVFFAMGLAILYFLFGLEGAITMLIISTVALVIGMPQSLSKTKDGFIEKVTNFLRDKTLPQPTNFCGKS